MRFKRWKPATLPCHIHSLPDEVLETIFHYAIEGRQYNAYPLTVRTLLTRICKRWRSITLSCPRLWSNLGVISFASSLSKTEKANMFHRIQLQLERSGTYPISFTFSDHKALEWGSLSECNKTLLLLARYSLQWQSVDITLSSTTTLQCLQSVYSRVPLLRDLTLRIRGDPQPYRVECFADAPSLRTVKSEVYFSGWGFPHTPIRVTLPWAQLAEYQEEGWPLEAGLAEVLSASGPLTSLSCTERGSLPSYPTMKHHSLTELNLQLFMAPFSLLRNLFLPSLTKLTIEYYDPHPQVVLTDVYTLLFHSECNLRCLTLDGPVSSEMELLRILELCKELHILRLRDVSCAFLKQLSLPKSEPQLLVPHLQEFTLLLSGFPPEEPPSYPIYPALDNFARSREEMHQNGVILERLQVEIRFEPYYIWEPQHMIVLPQLEGFPPTSGDAATDTTSKSAPELPHSNKLDQAGTAIQNSRSGATYTTVCRWEQVLNQSKRWRVLSTLEKIRRWSQYSSSIHEVMNEMEVYPITPLTLTWLYRMEIPQALGNISFQVPGSKLLKFGKRARKILDSWKPHLLADAMTNRRWAVCGGHSIVYLHADDERRSEEQAWNIVIGFPAQPLL